MPQPVPSSRILDLLTGAANRYKSEGKQGSDWIFFHMSDAERLAFDLFLVKMGDELAYQPGTTEYRFTERVRRMVEGGSR